MNVFYLDSYEVVATGWGAILYWSSFENDFIEDRSDKIFVTDSLDDALYEMDLAFNTWKCKNSSWIGISNVGLKVIKNKLIQEDNGNIKFMGESENSFKWKIPHEEIY